MTLVKSRSNSSLDNLAYGLKKSQEEVQITVLAEVDHANARDAAGPRDERNRGLRRQSAPETARSACRMSSELLIDKISFHTWRERRARWLPSPGPGAVANSW